MKLLRKKKCRCCGKFFRPDPRNHKKQRYCSDAACRKASKAYSQQKWVKKNPDYFRSKENILRVQEWRKNNPEYSKRRQFSSTQQNRSDTLQDSLIEKDKEKQSLTKHSSPLALQDLLVRQPAVFVGLIAYFSGSTLQDEIAVSIAKMLKMGQDILNSSNFNQGGSYDPEISHLSGESPPGTGTIQLDRPSSDP
jgi:hypothetical protein